MDALTLHIEYLLLRNDCVIVPGFGAFINAHSPAEICSAPRLCRPMSKEVRFNQAITHDDGLLATSFARREKISFDEGRLRVAASLQDWLARLAEGHKITVGRIGVIARLPEGNLEFNPSKSPADIAESLGFLPLDLTVAAKPRTVYTPDVEPTPVAEAGQKPLHLSRRENYYIPVPKVLVKMAASIVLLMVTVGILLLPDTRRHPHLDQASVMPVASLQLSSKSQQAERRAVKTVTPVQEETPAQTPSMTKTPDEEPYHLIVATFTSEADADRYISATLSGPFTLAKVKSGRMVRVSALSSSDKSILFSKLNSPDFRSRFAEGWVWHK